MTHLSRRFTKTAARLATSIGLVISALLSMQLGASAAGVYPESCDEKKEFTVGYSPEELGLLDDRPGEHSTLSIDETKQLAEKGDAKRQLELGDYYEFSHLDNGEKTTPDEMNLALRYYSAAAINGVADAIYKLGWLNYIGRSVPQNFTEAYKLFLSAAKQDHTEAQVMLGCMNLNGKGVAQNFVMAHAWLNIAAAKSNYYAQKLRGEVESKLTSTDLAKAQELATRCMKSSYKDCD